MDPKKRTKTILIAAAALFFIGLILIIFITVRNNSEKITVDPVPKNLKLTLNGKEISNKGAAVQPGTYTLEGSLSGFTTKKFTVTVKANEKKNVKMYLDPATQQAEQSIAKDQEQALKLEAEAGREHIKAVEKAVTDNPFIKELPYIGPGFSYRIDYGAPQDGNDKKFPGQPVIYIRANNSADHQSALTWMRNTGYNPDNMNIELITGSPGY